jgi:hypothetical protein
MWNALQPIARLRVDLILYLTIDNDKSSSLSQPAVGIWAEGKLLMSDLFAARRPTGTTSKFRKHQTMGPRTVRTLRRGNGDGDRVALIALACSPDGDMLAGGSISRNRATGGGWSVAVWDFVGKGPAESWPISLEHHQIFLTQPAYQNSGEILASGCEVSLVALWHPIAKPPLLSSFRLSAPAAQLAWSPADRALAVGAADGLVTLLESFDSDEQPSDA